MGGQGVVTFLNLRGVHGFGVSPSPASFRLEHPVPRALQSQLSKTLQPSKQHEIRHRHHETERREPVHLQTSGIRKVH